MTGSQNLVINMKKGLRNESVFYFLNLLCQSNQGESIIHKKIACNQHLVTGYCYINYCETDLSVSTAALLNPVFMYLGKTTK